MDHNNAPGSPLEVSIGAAAIDLVSGVRAMRDNAPEKVLIRHDTGMATRLHMYGAKAVTVALVKLED
jgi:hypothetical protein